MNPPDPKEQIQQQAINQFLTALQDKESIKAAGIVETHKDIANAYSDQNMSLLAHAIQEDNGYVVSKLMDYGADINAPASKDAPFSAQAYAQMGLIERKSLRAWEAISSHEQKPIEHGYIQEINMKSFPMSREGMTEDLKKLPPDADIHIYHGTKISNPNQLNRFLDSPGKGVQQRFGPTFSLIPSGAFWASNGVDPAYGFRYTLKRNEVCFEGDENPKDLPLIQNDGLIDIGSDKYLSIEDHPCTIMRTRMFQDNAVRDDYRPSVYQEQPMRRIRKPITPEAQEAEKILAQKMEQLQSRLKDKTPALSQETKSTQEPPIPTQQNHPNYNALKAPHFEIQPANILTLTSIASRNNKIPQTPALTENSITQKQTPVKQRPKQFMTP